VVDDLIGRVKDGEPVEWRYDLGEDVYVIIKAPQLTIHIRKYFVSNGEWTLHPTKRGVTLILYEWKGKSPEGVEGCAHAQPEVAQYPPSGPFPPPPPPPPTPLWWWWRRRRRREVRGGIFGCNYDLL
jgi:hypothetical protein